MNKLLCKLGFHKWKYVREYYTKTFLGEEVKLHWNRFRICKRCGKVEEYWTAWDFWDSLHEEYAKVLKSKVIDKGKYYVLPKQKGVKND